ncbi:LacI family transcriptional regulator [Pedobacter sp. CG_S7]|uniref:LacI family DNA-binding transcriptional regulator n=1 Tax=Pedobacter sp. CG_S7 TaxID=3143930 RepID=UPI003398497A
MAFACLVVISPVETNILMKDKTITIKDIAIKAMVSTGTVDRVLHNRGRVSATVQEKVLKILKEMDYEPNLIARALSSKKTYHIAALIPDEAYDSYWHAPKEGILKAEKDLKQYGLVVDKYLFNPNKVESFVEKAREATASSPDGILLSPIFQREALPFFKQWKETAIPFVLINTEITACEPISYIGQDSYKSGYLAGKLVQYGQPNPCAILIAHFDEDLSNSAHLEKKEQGFRNYFSQNNLFQYTIIKAELNSSNYASFVKQLDELFESTPDLKSVFVSTSKAYEIATYLKQRHIHHIKIVGYDLVLKNLHFLENNFISFLINQNPKGQGYWGLKMFADHLIFKKEVPILKYLPLDVVTKENANYFIGDDVEERIL